MEIRNTKTYAEVQGIKWRAANGCHDAVLVLPLMLRQQIREGLLILIEYGTC
jgi:hypothetical protein